MHNFLSQLRVLLAVAVLLVGLMPWQPVLGQVPFVPPNKVKVTVTPTVTFDPVTRLFTYEYEVFNDPTSEQEVDMFAIDFSRPIQDIINPRGWTHGFFFDRSTLSWGATETPKELVPPEEEDRGQIIPSPFQIKPGSSVRGFSFRSPNPPGTVRFFVKGFTLLPSGLTFEEAERLAEETPELALGFFDLAVSGTTQGPVPAVRGDLNIERARVELLGLSSNRFEVRGSFVLGANSDGIDVLNEDVTVTFGGFSETISAGSFFRDDDDEGFQFDGTPGSITQVNIRDDGEIRVKARDLALSGIDLNNPVPFSLQIGNDLGETGILFDDDGRFKQE